MKSLFILYWMVKQLSLTNSKDIVCNSVRIINGNILQDNFDAFLLKSEADRIVGIPPDTLDTLQKIASALGDDPFFSQR